MIKFVRKIKLTAQLSTGLLLSGNIKDVMNSLQNLSFIFCDCSISRISQSEISEAVEAIDAVKRAQLKIQSRRQL